MINVESMIQNMSNDSKNYHYQRKTELYKYLFWTTIFVLITVIFFSICFYFAIQCNSIKNSVDKSLEILEAKP